MQKCSDEALELQQKYEGKIASLSANEASNVIVCYEQIIILLGKISSHADLCFAADTSNPEFAQHSQNMREAINAVQSNLVFIELELASISELQYLQMLMVFLWRFILIQIKVLAMDQTWYLFIESSH